jgi:hypothetical protein
MKPEEEKRNEKDNIIEVDGEQINLAELVRAARNSGDYTTSGLNRKLKVLKPFRFKLITLDRILNTLDVGKNIDYVQSLNQYVTDVFIPCSPNVDIRFFEVLHPYDISWETANEYLARLKSEFRESSYELFNHLNPNNISSHFADLRPDEDLVQAIKIALNEEPDFELSIKNDLAEIEKKYFAAIEQLELNEVSNVKLPNHLSFDEYKKYLLKEKQKEIDFTKFKYRTFFSKAEIKDVALSLVEYKLAEKVNLTASIGYDPNVKPEQRYEQLNEFYLNDGRNKKQKKQDKTRKKIDQNVIISLKSIAEHEHTKIKNLANKMILMYEMVQSFHV